MKYFTASRSIADYICWETPHEDIMKLDKFLNVLKYNTESINK